MFLLVGLGNPGSKYEKNRHNIGFMAVDDIVHRHNFSPERTRFQGLACDGRLGSEKVLALKPQTYMNESGRSVGDAMRFFKLEPAQVIVLYDELDIPHGKVKVKVGGGHAGHNGIRSITNHIGAEFMRVRIGIGHPGDKARVHGHVLGDFAKSEEYLTQTIIEAISKEIPSLIDGDTASFQSDIARYINPPRSSTGTKKNSNEPKNTIEPAKASFSMAKKEINDGPMANALKALKKD